MGVMKDYQLTMAAIQESYDLLCDDEDVERLHLYRPILRAAEAVLGADPKDPLPHSLDLVEYALVGALADLERLRIGWRERGLR